MTVSPSCRRFRGISVGLRSRNLAQISRNGTAEEDHEAVGRKVSAMFLAQVEIEEDKAGKAAAAKEDGGGGEGEESKQKKGFLQGLR